MKMSLEVSERLMISLVLPGEGNVMTIRLVNDLKNRLGFNTEEAETLKVKTNEDSGDAQWDRDAEKVLGEVEFEFNRVERKILVPALERVIKRLNLMDKLKLAHLLLHEKFVGQEKADAFVEGLEKAAMENEKKKEDAAAKAALEAAEKKKENEAALAAIQDGKPDEETAESDDVDSAEDDPENQG